MSLKARWSIAVYSTSLFTPYLQRTLLRVFHRSYRQHTHRLLITPSSLLHSGKWRGPQSARHCHPRRLRACARRPHSRSPLCSATPPARSQVACAHTGRRSSGWSTLTSPLRTYQQLDVVALNGVRDRLLEAGERGNQLWITHSALSHRSRVDCVRARVCLQHHIQVMAFFEVHQHVVAGHVQSVHTTHLLHCTPQSIQQGHIALSSLHSGAVQQIQIELHRVKPHAGQAVCLLFHGNAILYFHAQGINQSSQFGELLSGSFHTYSLEYNQGRTGNDFFQCIVIALVLSFCMYYPITFHSCSYLTALKKSREHNNCEERTDLSSFPRHYPLIMILH